jgi:hypothetical protein
VEGEDSLASEVHVGLVRGKGHGLSSSKIVILSIHTTLATGPPTRNFRFHTHRFYSIAHTALLLLIPSEAKVVAEMIEKWIESLKQGQCIPESDLKKLCAMVCLHLGGHEVFLHCLIFLGQRDFNGRGECPTGPITCDGSAVLSSSLKNFSLDLRRYPRTVL